MKLDPLIHFSGLPQSGIDSISRHAPPRGRVPDSLPRPVVAEPTPDAIAREILAPLLDPAKVATLKGDRPANSRLYKVLGWLETARRAGGDPAAAIDTAQTVAGYAGTVGAKADKAAIHWSRMKLEDFGAFISDGIAELRKGHS